MTEEAKKWIAALKSGKYKQGRGTLLRGDEWCCLGVMEDVVNDKADWVMQSWGRYDGDTWTLVVEGAEFPHTRMPSETTMRKVDPEGRLNMHDFTKFNDMWAWSFNRIAEYIERKLS